MKRKIETSLRRAMDQLPQPDYWTVAEAPVQKMEVHDYVTRQDVSVRPVRRRALPLALAACALALAVGLYSYFRFFQIYSVVDLTVNPSFALALNRGDQVRNVTCLLYTSFSLTPPTPLPEDGGILARRQANEPLELIGQMALVGKPRLQGGFRRRGPRLQQPLGLPHPGRHQVAVGGDAPLPGEGPDEAVLGPPRHS